MGEAEEIAELCRRVADHGERRVGVREDLVEVDPADAGAVCGRRTEVGDGEEGVASGLSRGGAMHDGKSVLDGSVLAELEAVGLGALCCENGEEHDGGTGEIGMGLAVGAGEAEYVLGVGLDDGGLVDDDVANLSDEPDGDNDELDAAVLDMVARADDAGRDAVGTVLDHVLVDARDRGKLGQGTHGHDGKIGDFTYRAKKSGRVCDGGR